MLSIWFRYDFDMILIWFWYAKVYDFLMVLESLRFFDMILIWFSYGFGVPPFFWYDFDMIFLWFWSLSVFLIWFSYGFGVPPFSWYDFLMVLECLRFLDMIFLWFWGASVFLIWFRYCFRPATSPTPVAGPRPHLPSPSSDPSHTSHARRRTHLPSRRQTVEPLRNSLISNFGFFLILLDLQARCSMLQTYRVQFEYKLYHFVGEAGKKKRFS